MPSHSSLQINWTASKMARTRTRTSSDCFMEILNREFGFSNRSSFIRRISASEVLVRQMDLNGELAGHAGCVNSAEFNSSGDLLVSGSDDRKVICWNWEDKTQTFSYPSGHLDNVFQARFTPFTNDRRIVTSSADGQVRLGEVLPNGRVETKMLGRHHGRVFKLAVEPTSPHIFYSCGEDGLVQHFDVRTTCATGVFSCSSFSFPQKSIRLNSIAIHPRDPNYMAVGGSDEYARVYDIRNCTWRGGSSNLGIPVNTFCTPHLVGTKNLYITGLVYSNKSELLISYNDELIYLFQKNMGLGSFPLPLQPEALQKLGKPKVFSGHRNARTFKGVSFFGPDDEYVMSGSDCGHIFIWERNEGKLIRMMSGDRHAVNHLDPHPYMPLFATCGMGRSVKLWAPTASEASPVHNADKVMESNTKARENRSMVVFSQEEVMIAIQPARLHILALMERR